MTARTETTMPLSPESREHLREHIDELLDLAGSLEQERHEIRVDQRMGLPVEDDVLRLVRDAADLLVIAARRLDPDQEPTR